MKVVKIKKSQISPKIFTFSNDNWGLLSSKIAKRKLEAYSKGALSSFMSFFQALNQNQAMGFAALKELKWDSKHFQKKMGLVDLLTIAQSSRRKLLAANMLLSQVLKEAKSKGYCHLTLKLDNSLIEEIEIAQRLGFFYKANLISYLINLKDLELRNSDSDILISQAKKKETKEIEKIAHDSFSDRNIWLDRFHADINLPKKKSDELYVKWIRNCLLGREADIVLSAKVKGRVAGFISAKTDKDIKKYLGLKIATIPLNAVSKKHRGKGIYKLMVKAVLSEYKNKGYDAVIITTQLSTKAVGKTWLSLGANIFSSRMVMHKTLR
jgi:GNAT superfamily N-acetyltransferase